MSVECIEYYFLFIQFDDALHRVFDQFLTNQKEDYFSHIEVIAKLRAVPTWNNENWSKSIRNRQYLHCKSLAHEQVFLQFLIIFTCSCVKCEQVFRDELSLRS